MGEGSRQSEPGRPCAAGMTEEPGPSASGAEAQRGRLGPEHKPDQELATLGPWGGRAWGPFSLVAAEGWLLGH